MKFGKNTFLVLEFWGIGAFSLSCFKLTNLVFEFSEMCLKGPSIKKLLNLNEKIVRC